MKNSARGLSSAFILSLSATGCSGLFGFGNGETVKLTTALPDQTQCEFIAQAVGTGTGGIFGAEHGHDEAEDNIEDIASRRGGNTVHILETKTNKLAENGDDSETILTGHVYRCR